MTGVSVALSETGARILVGGLYAEYAAVYDLIGTQWVQIGADIKSGNTNDEFGYSVAMSGAGSRIAVGASSIASSFDFLGIVRIYDWNGANWNKPGLDIKGDANGNRAGTRVVLSQSGLRIAVCSFLSDRNGKSDSGHVSVYNWNGTNWLQLGADIVGEAAGDQSGYLQGVAMSSSGSRIIIGAILNDGIGKADCGHARIYDWSGESWVQIGQDIDGEAAGDKSGLSVAMSASGSRILIGASLNDGNGKTDSGNARVYDWNGANWIQLGQDIDGEAAGDNFGASVAISASGSRIVVGGPNNNGKGHVRIFDWNGASWIQFDQDIDGQAAGDLFGSAVAISNSGSIILVGAYKNDASGTNNGAVKVYQVCDLFADYPYNALNTISSQPLRCVPRLLYQIDP
jgi:hypothetical protein